MESAGRCYHCRGLSLRDIGLLVALYPAVWGVTQVATGALSDRSASRGGRRYWIAGGMLVQGAALVLIGVASGVPAWIVAAVLLGLGTAAVYRRCSPRWRGRSRHWTGPAR